MSAYNFGDSGPNLTRLYQGTWFEARVIKCTLGVPPTKFGSAKKNLARFWTTFDLIANVSGTHRPVKNLNTT